MRMAEMGEEPAGGWSACTTGERVGNYSNWAPFAPDEWRDTGGTEEDCAQLLPHAYRGGAAGAWNDRSCDIGKALACELPSDR